MEQQVITEFPPGKFLAKGGGTAVGCAFGTATCRMPDAGWRYLAHCEMRRKHRGRKPAREVATLLIRAEAFVDEFLQPCERTCLAGRPEIGEMPGPVRFCREEVPGG